MTTDKATRIKQDLAETKGRNQALLAAKHGVSRSLISEIWTGRTHKDIPWPDNFTPTHNPAGGQMKDYDLEDQNIILLGKVENLTKERNQLKRQLKSAAKQTATVDDVLEQLTPLVAKFTPFQKQPLKRGKVIDETLVLVLSDVHADEVVHPEEVDHLENYNFPIAVRRAEVLVDELLQFTQVSLSNFRFKKLCILALGDYTSGQIHDHVHRSYFQDQFTSDLMIGQLFARMFTDLAPHFKEVEVVNITGNHGRLTETAQFTKDAAKANHDTLIVKIAEAHCKDIKNVSFQYPTGMSCIYAIEGWNHYLTHGHAQPGGSMWQRAKRTSQTISPLHKGNVKYAVSGHFHTEGSIRVSGGMTLIGNGAFLACDAYSYQKLQEASEPTQTIFGVHPKHGVTWRLPVKLRTEDEGLGPKRYGRFWEN